MEQVAISVPYEFIKDRAKLTWREVKYGIEEALLAPPDAIDVAVDYLVDGVESESVVRLASLERDAPVLEYVVQLAQTEPERDVVAISDKWAFLVLAWLFEHRDRYADPLGLVEKVYADLGYPEKVAPFVRYMPSDEPALGSSEAHEQRLLQRWADYVEEGTDFYAGVQRGAAEQVE